MARGVEVHVIHASSVSVPREHRRAKTDRLDTELLKDRLESVLMPLDCRSSHPDCRAIVLVPALPHS